LFAARFTKSTKLQVNLKHLFLDLGLALGLAGIILGVLTIVPPNGGLAYDTHAYWLAARNVLNSQVLYVKADYSTLNIYTYPPLFAQLFTPAGWLPELLVTWLWRISGILCLRYLVGSWKAAVVACAFLPVLIELSIGNVTLQIAAAAMFALRDRRGAYLVPWLAALKFGPVLLVPYLWFRMPESRRPLVIGSLVFGAFCLISYLLAPGDWLGYFNMLGWQNSANLGGAGVIHLIGGAGGLDFIVRFGLATVIVFYATYAKRAWLAYAAAVITCPVLAISRFAPLVGFWRFRPEKATVLAEVKP